MTAARKSARPKPRRPPCRGFLDWVFGRKPARVCEKHARTADRLEAAAGRLERTADVFGEMVKGMRGSAPATPKKTTARKGRR